MSIEVHNDRLKCISDLEPKLASLQRIALYIMFDELERDLINLISSIASTPEGVLTDDEVTKAKQRLKRPEIDADQGALEVLLHNLDLGEKIDIVFRLRKELPDAHAKYLVSKKTALDNAIGVRNSIMHGRPLTIAEYAQGFALASDLARSPHYWPSLSRSLRAYNSNPESVRSRSIEIIESNDLTETLNNLPIPDYDDTGFLPRTKLEAELKKKILSRHPVVTVLGDGGNGKTALTLQTLYGLLNDPSHGFDGIVWVSAKSSTLTPREIQRIENAITTSAGIFSRVAEGFEVSRDPIESVRELLANNKILLVIDNLETVLDKSIRDFISDIPGESKVLFTSRIPVGSDITVSVDEFTERESLIFLRRVIDAYSVNSLKAAPDSALLPYIRRLGGKPLLIKWFALSVRAGVDPGAVVRNPENALRFCLENVFDSLDEAAKQVASILAQLPRAVSLEVLRFISGVDALDLERGISSLLMYTIVYTRDAGAETLYELKPFARAYIARIMNLRPEHIEKILVNFRSLEGLLQEEAGASSKNRYDMRTYTVRNTSEALCVRQLRRAIHCSNKLDFEEAHKLLNAIKVTNPNYFEIYRVEAFVFYERKDFMSANESYLRAIDLAPDLPQLRFFYAGFLVRAYNDYDGAVREIETALTEDKEASRLTLELGRIKMFRMDFEGAISVVRSIPLTYDRIDKLHCAAKDVEFNIHKRNVEHLSLRGTSAQVEDALNDWAEFHERLDPRTIDEKLLSGIKNLAERVISLYSKFSSAASGRLFAAMRENIVFCEPIHTTLEGIAPDAGLLRGRIKLHGLQKDFGFIISEGGVEFFIHKSACTVECWELVKSGKACYFSTAVDPSGRLRVSYAKVV